MELGYVLVRSRTSYSELSGSSPTMTTFK